MPPGSGGALVRRSYAKVTGERPTTEPPRQDIADEDRRPTGRGGRDLVDRFAGDDVIADEDLAAEDAGATASVARAAVRRGREGAPGDRADRGSEGTDEARLATSMARAVSPQRAARLEARVKDASRAFRKERFGEAIKILKPIAKEAPSVPDVRELLGVTLYRLGRWKPALRELEAFAQLTGSTEQHPVMEDCQRALGRHDEVQRLWAELREASPDGGLVMEGRIVAAGDLADQGRLDEAIALLEHGTIRPRRPKEHHLRRAYALADLYERAGSLARARELFGWLAEQDPDLADVVDRVRALR